MGPYKLASWRPPYRLVRIDKIVAMYRYKVINGELIVLRNEITFVFLILVVVEVDVIVAEHRIKHWSGEITTSRGVKFLVGKIDFKSRIEMKTI